MDRGVEELILNNTDLVYSIIYKMRIRINDDIISEGMVALIEAARNYDAAMGTQFSTYAVSYIKGKLKTYLTLRTTVVKPSRIRGHYVKIETIQSDSEVNEVEGQNENIESSLIVNDFLHRLTPREKLVAQRLMQDRTQKQIGEELNICQAQVCQMIRVIRYKYMAYSLEAKQY